MDAQPGTTLPIHYETYPLSADDQWYPNGLPIECLVWSGSQSSNSDQPCGSDIANNGSQASSDPRLMMVDASDGEDTRDHWWREKGPRAARRWENTYVSGSSSSDDLEVLQHVVPASGPYILQ